MYRPKVSSLEVADANGLEPYPEYHLLLHQLQLEQQNNYQQFDDAWLFSQPIDKSSIQFGQNQGDSPDQLIHRYKSEQRNDLTTE